MIRQLEELGKDVVGGAVMVLIGAGVIWQARHYPLGTLSRMGPGFFPFALGVILTALGAVIAGVGWIARRTAPPPETRLPPEWRAWFLICASIVAFVVLATYGGLLPATFAIVFISALADRANTWRAALLLALAMAAIAWVVFWWALQLQLPPFQWG